MKTEILYVAQMKAMASDKSKGAKTIDRGVEK